MVLGMFLPGRTDQTALSIMQHPWPPGSPFGVRSRIVIKKGQPLYLRTYSISDGHPSGFQSSQLVSHVIVPVEMACA